MKKTWIIHKDFMKNPPGSLLIIFRIDWEGGFVRQSEISMAL
jgi:hypothetical protein